MTQSQQSAYRRPCALKRYATAAVALTMVATFGATTAQAATDDTTPPAPVTGLVAPASTSKVWLNWDDSSESDLRGYLVYRASALDGEYVRLTAGPRTTSLYTDLTAPAGTRSYYRVTAVDAGGNESAPTQVVAVRKDGVAPAAPTSLVASGSADGITLEWEAGGEADLAGYVVSRSQTKWGGYTRLTSAPVTDPTFVDTTAPVGKVSYYRVSAVDLGGHLSVAARASATVLAADDTAPAQVTGLVAPSSTSKVWLNWDDSDAPDLRGYLVYRATSPDGEYARLTATPRLGSYFTDLTAPVGTPAYYRVAAVDANGNESAPAQVVATRKDGVAPSAPASLLATGVGGGVALEWDDNAEADLAGYVVSRSATRWGGYTTLTGSPITESAFVDTTAPEGVPSYYKVSAVDHGGQVSAAARASATAVAPADTTAPAPPAGVTATGTTDGVSLDWADQAEADLAGYLVYRSDSADGEFARLTDVPLPVSAYTDTSAQAGMTSYYRIVAVDSVGNASTPATAEAVRAVAKVPVAGADVTVATDGSGDYTTIADALAAAPVDAAVPFVIGIRPGTYRELLTISRPNVTLLGATTNASDVVITYDNSASTAKPDGSGTYGTSGSATVLIKSNNVTVRNLTFENGYVETGSGSEQAVALKTQGDRLVFDNVRVLGDQDTLYADSPRPGALARSYFVRSYIEGDVDFIFGRGTAVFDRSTIKAATRGSSSNNGYVTAASTDTSLPYGYLITDSTIVSDAPAETFHLGRPWQPSGDPNAVAQVVIRNTELPAAIKSSPWTDMSSTFSWRNARFFEYNNSGPGAAVNADRPQLTDAEAARYTKWTYLAGADGWNPTGEAAPPPPADTTAPAAPTGLAADAGDSKVALTWTANAEEDLAGYHVYRAAGATVEASPSTRLTTSPVAEATYVDRTAANGTEYSYLVTAVDRAGNESPVSQRVSAAPVGVPLPAHDILVAADGTGQYTSVQDAVNSIPSGSTAAKVIAVKPGTYREVVTIQNRWNVTIVGATGDARDVVITYDNAAGTPKADGSGTLGTDGSATFFVKGNGITLKDLTVENAFDEAAVALAGGEQAVALFVQGDKFVADNVRLLANQDTLYLKTPNLSSPGRSYFTNSYIEGDVDFIFGHGTAVIANSTIKALSRGSSSNNGYLTAASTDASNPYGILITDSRVISDAPAGTFHLGRPWQAFSTARGQVTIRNTELPAAIKDAPWTSMGNLQWTDGRFFEYQNTGPGAAVNDTRPQLTDEQAADHTAEKYLTGTDGWNPVGS